MELEESVVELHIYTCVYLRITYTVGIYRDEKDLYLSVVL